MLEVKEKAEHFHSDSSVGDVFKRQKSRSDSICRRHFGSSRSKGVVTLMLSSPVTLLTMSIRKGNFTQTKQIIKVMLCLNLSRNIETPVSQF